MGSLYIVSIETLLLVCTLFLCSCYSAEISSEKILAVIASDNFRDEELFVPKKIFEDAGFKVVIASLILRPAKGSLGATTMPDISLDAVRVDDYAAVVFIGGGGASEYWDNATAHRVITEAAKKKKVLAAICIAPVTLANAGVLDKKKATVWHSEADKLTSKGAYYTGSAVEVDGGIVTANGPTAAPAFAKAILKKLGK